MNRSVILNCASGQFRDEAVYKRSALRGSKLAEAFRKLGVQLQFRTLPRPESEHF